MIFAMDFNYFTLLFAIYLLLASLFPSEPLLLSSGPTPHRSQGSLRLILIDALSYQLALKYYIPLLNYQHGCGTVLKSIAESPTMTSQRIRALMSGFNPNFLEFGRNFNSVQAQEDNLLKQLKNKGGSSVLLGDDTWQKLFGESLTSRHPCQSFNVKDFTSCDELIEQKLFQQNKKEFDFLIAHFLGVDHLGHSLSVNQHPLIVEKLKNISTLTNRLIGQLSDNSYLIVTSDHGMLSNGNHGGSSLDETQTFALIYSKQLCSKLQNLRLNPVIKQVDLTPTMSFITGVPVPANNKGIPVDVQDPEWQSFRSLFNLSQRGLEKEVDWMGLALGVAVLVLLALARREKSARSWQLIVMGLPLAHPQLSYLSGFLIVAIRARRLFQEGIKKSRLSQLSLSLLYSSQYLSYFLLRHEDSFKLAFFLFGLGLQHFLFKQKFKLSICVLLAVAFNLGNPPSQAQFQPSIFNLVSLPKLHSLVPITFNALSLLARKGWLVALIAFTSLGCMLLKQHVLGLAVGLLWLISRDQQSWIVIGVLVSGSEYAGLYCTLNIIRLWVGKLNLQAIKVALQDWAWIRIGARHQISSFDVNKAFLHFSEFSLLSSGVWMAGFLSSPRLLVRCQKVGVWHWSVQLIVLALTCAYNYEKILFLVIYAQTLVVRCLVVAFMTLFDIYS